MVPVTSLRLGQLSVPTQHCFTMVAPLLGFEAETRFAIIEHEADSPFHWLQSLTSPQLTFILTVPALFNLEYSFTIPPQAQGLLQVDQAENLWVYTLVTVPNDNPQGMTTNLVAPLLFNPKNGLGMQLVLDNAPKHYTTRVPLLADAEAQPTAGEA
jgi:flagellar assembly factor FliW